MMKIASVFIFLLVTISMFSCKTAGKLQKTTGVISKVDTTPVAVTDTLKTVDSAELIKEVYNKAIKNKIDFNTFNAKARVVYNDKDGGDEATAFIRVKKDSAIWLSLRGPLGIEGFRVLITTDSIKVMNLLKKYVQYRSIDFLQQLTGLPLDFTALQDIVVGNPVFIDSNISSYMSDSNHLQILMTGKLFKHLATLDNNDYKIVESKLDDLNDENRTCDIAYSGYDNTSGVPFSTERKISLADQSKLNIDLNFKQYVFNQPLTFPFNISENYKRL
ncbi:DUF4292 domain-containing protein [Segetibacter koreensis]|uniref:DUF4292 domain-containing protein n=1 Tax=Segetibacter koreensis TaxID=398037 RepID=UPI0003637FE4|nr:DUF4292 domain-containing protein [Segetibacter koreensis]